MAQIPNTSCDPSQTSYRSQNQNEGKCGEGAKIKFGSAPLPAVSIWSRFELFVCLLVLGGGGFAWTGQILKRSGSNLPDLNWFKVWPKKGPQGLMHSNSSQQPNQFSSCCRIKNRFKMFFRPIICMPKRS